jgi:hypothetical protein
MTSLRKILIAVVTQLRDRGGVLHEDAQYWLSALRAGESEGDDDPHTKIRELEARLAEAEEKIEFLGDFTGAKASGEAIVAALEEPAPSEPPAEEDDYLDEDPRGY